MRFGLAGWWTARFLGSPVPLAAAGTGLFVLVQLFVSVVWSSSFTVSCFFTWYSWGLQGLSGDEMVGTLSVTYISSTRTRWILGAF